MTDFPKNIPINQWAKDDRPREKLLLKGRASLSDAELVAILINKGTKEHSAVGLAQKILALTQNNLTELGRLSVKDFQKVKGIGEAKGITIVAALELGRRRKNEIQKEKPQIRSSKDSFNYLYPILSDLPHEEFWILLLNRANKVIGCKRVSEGGTAGTVVDNKIVMKHAIENLATSLVLCHNHPSGALTPSDADVKLTHKLQNALALIDVSILDHLIIGYGNYFSFTDNGIL